MATASNTDFIEIWKPVPGWEGLYEASSLGFIRSFDRVVLSISKNGVRRTWTSRGRILRPSITRKGYLGLALSRPGERATTREVHRLVCLAFHGPPPTDIHHAAHRNGKRTDNRAENLRWATPKDNQADQYAHGTRRLGESHPLAKLTNKQVREIRARATRGEMQADIARCLGVSQGQVSSIVLRQTWKHI